MTAATLDRMDLSQWSAFTIFRSKSSKHPTVSSRVHAWTSFLQASSETTMTNGIMKKKRKELLHWLVLGKTESRCSKHNLDHTTTE